jgi:pyridoxamine 5'-phosphate oxidase
MTVEQLRDRIASERIDYSVATLSETDVAGDPIIQFSRWFADALNAGIVEPNAMTLATVDEAGLPNARMVLLRAADERGFSFFTNYTSTKGQELAACSHAALVFYWRELNRQARIRGKVEKVTPAESAEYFASRPRGSQIAAWASRQSQPVPGRQALEEAVAALETRFAGSEVPLPEFWGGYRVIPDTIEFWQGRPNRLHDRIRYQRHNGGWTRQRLSP